MVNGELFLLFSLLAIDWSLNFGDGALGGGGGGGRAETCGVASKALSG